MASLVGVHRRRSPEDDGEDERSGNGRSQRRRLSPEEDTASPAEPAGTSPGWLSTFVSGAKRVFSSVLLLSSPEEQALGDEDENDGDSEDEDGNGLSANENEDVHDTVGAIVPYSDSKHAIKQMVMNEKFSRDEFDKMVELLKTRITDSELLEAREYGTPKEVPSRNMRSGHDFTGAWRSLGHDRTFLESVPFSNMKSGSFSPGSPLQASPELCTAAVKEAKKWLEEKRKGMDLNPEDTGPCTSNTDMHSSGFDSDMDSPVDLAKSYMRSLPPWQSPFLSSQRFNTSSSGVRVYDDGRSSKVIVKEDYLSNFWANLEESRRACKESSGGSTDGSKFRHYGFTSRLFVNDTSLLSLGTNERVGEPAQTDHGSDKIAATEPANGCHISSLPSEDGNNGIAAPLNPAKDKVCGGKDATGHSGDIRHPIVQNGESHMNSASALRSKDAGPPVQIGTNGSTNKTFANGLLDRSKANSGIESSGNDNPNCTNSSSAVPPTSKDFTESAADAADVVSGENGTGMNPEEPSKGTKELSVRRGRKRGARGTGVRRSRRINAA